MQGRIGGGFGAAAAAAAVADIVQQCIEIERTVHDGGKNGISQSLLDAVEGFTGDGLCRGCASCGFETCLGTQEKPDIFDSFGTSKRGDKRVPKRNAFACDGSVRDFHAAIVLSARAIASPATVPMR